MKNELKSLEEMTLVELENLYDKAHNIIEQKREQERETKKEEFFGNNSAGIREKINELRKKHNELCKTKHKVTISADVSLNLNNNQSFDSLFNSYNYEHDVSDIFGLEINTELLDKKNFDPEIVGEIESRLEDMASEACFEAARLKPELLDSLEDFKDEVNQILKDFEEFEVTDEEREKFLKPVRVAKKKTTAKKGKK